RVGGGRIQAQGDGTPAAGWSVRAQVDAVDPAALHSALAAQPVRGTVALKVDGARTAADPAAPPGISFDAALRALPARRGTGDDWALALDELAARGRWSDGLLTLASLRVAGPDLLLQGRLRLQPRTLA